MPRELRPSQNPAPAAPSAGLSKYKEIVLDQRKARRLLFRPSWDFTILLFRPLPIFDPKTNSFTPYKDGDMYGKWLGSDFVIGQVSSGFRTGKCVLKHQCEGTDVLDQSPIYVLAQQLSLYDRAKQALANNKRDVFEQLKPQLLPKVWSLYQQDSLTQVRAKPASFVQAIVYAVKSQPIPAGKGLYDDDLAPVVILEGSAQTALIEALQPQNPSEPEADAIDPAAGRLIEIGRKGYDRRSWFPTSGAPDSNYFAARAFVKYGANPVISAALGNDARILELLKLKTTPWEDMFVLLDEKEQMDLLVWSGVNPAYIYLLLGDLFTIPDIITKAAQRTLGRPVTVPDVPQAPQPVAQPMTPVPEPEAVSPPWDEEALPETPDAEVEAEVLNAAHQHIAEMVTPAAPEPAPTPAPQQAKPAAKPAPVGVAGQLNEAKLDEYINKLKRRKA